MIDPDTTNRYKWFALGASTLLIFTQLYSWIREPSVGLHARIEPAEIFYHPNIKKQIEGIGKLEGGKKFQEKIEELMRYDGYWKIEVENTGDKRLEDVKIHLPEPSFARIIFNGETTESIRKSIITLDSLSADDKVRVEVWTHAWYYKPKGRIKITHKNGKGSMEFLLPVGSWGQWVENDLPNTLLIASLIVILFSIATSGKSNQVTS